MVRVDTLVDQHIADGIGAAGTEGHVVGFRTALVRMSFDEQIGVAMALHVFCDGVDAVEIILTFNQVAVIFKVDILENGCEGRLCAWILKGFDAWNRAARIARSFSWLLCGRESAHSHPIALIGICQRNKIGFLLLAHILRLAKAINCKVIIHIEFILVIDSARVAMFATERPETPSALAAAGFGIFPDIIGRALAAQGRKAGHENQREMR